MPLDDARSRRRKDLIVFHLTENPQGLTFGCLSRKLMKAMAKQTLKKELENLEHDGIITTDRHQRQGQKDIITLSPSSRIFYEWIEKPMFEKQIKTMVLVERAMDFCLLAEPDPLMRIHFLIFGVSRWVLDYFDRCLRDDVITAANIRLATEEKAIKTQQMLSKVAFAALPVFFEMRQRVLADALNEVDKMRLEDLKNLSLDLSKTHSGSYSQIISKFNENLIKAEKTEPDGYRANSIFKGAVLDAVDEALTSKKREKINQLIDDYLKAGFDIETLLATGSRRAEG